MASVIVDYNSGNLHSARKSFMRVAEETGAGEIAVTSDPEAVRRADRVILPGVGAFADCKAGLEGVDGMPEAIEESVVRGGRPFLGICVGMQLMATVGLEKGKTPGFGWISGRVEGISPKDPKIKIPHMGWNDIEILQPHPVLGGIETGDHFYFVHSYRFAPSEDSSSIAQVEYGESVCAVAGRDNLVGTQFHPEKSQGNGLRLIANFLKWSP